MSSPTKRPLTPPEDCVEEKLDDNQPPKKRKTEPIGNNGEISRIQVFVRVRPTSQNGDETRRTIDVVDDTMLVFDPLDDNQEYLYHGKMYREIGRRKNKNKTYVFDGVFGESSTNMDVYQSVTKRFVSALLDGFNCTVFAYGATGSGKTHTMLGSGDEPGVIFFTAKELFSSIEAKADEEKLEVSVSYFQIYNEVIMDLLAATTGKDLCVRSDPKGDFFVSNLSVHHPKNADHLIQMLEYGNTQRSKQATDANENSSRSHAILQLTIKKRDFSSSQQMCIQLSKMCLIDLAGSERASVAYQQNRDKKLQREGSNINKSLLALGNCINALSKNQKCTFRDSKLTRLLKDSLGGNCQTAMIATVNPGWKVYEDTHNTLTYAQSTRGIQLSVKRQSIAIGLQPRNYTLALETLEKRNTELQEENRILREEKEKLQKQLNAAPKNPIHHEKSSSDLLNSFKNSLDEMFDMQLDFRRQLLECESNLRKIDLKLAMKKLDNERLKQLPPLDESNEPVKHEQVQALYSQKLHYTTLRDNLAHKVEEVERNCVEMEQNMRSRVDGNDFLTNMYFTNQHLRIEAQNKEINQKHASEVADDLMSRFEANEEVVIEAMSLNHQVEMMLRGMNRFSDELKDKFTALRKKVECKKNVVWRDDAVQEKRSFLKDFEIHNVFILPIHKTTPSRKENVEPRDLVTICAGLTPPALEPPPKVNVTVTKNVPTVQPGLKERNGPSLNDTFSLNHGGPRSSSAVRNLWKPYPSNNHNGNGYSNRNRHRFRATWRNNDSRWPSNSSSKGRTPGNDRPSSPFVNNARFRF